MIEILETVSPEAVAVSVQGTITMDDYRKVSPLIFGKIEAYGKIPVMLSLKDINTTAAKALWHGIKPDLKHVENFSRLALVVDSTKFKVLIHMAKPFIPVELKVFGEGEEAAAIAWITQ